MTTIKTKSILAASLIAIMFMLGVNDVSASELDQYDLYEIRNKEELKHGQYVYVTLKNGSQTVGKIVGKRNSKKYYVNQLDGGHHGVVHKKYIRKMTKEEVEQYKMEKNKS
ncbi:hypothetical protein [Ekhidna sp.]